MELEFDKEIDALLRKAKRASPAAVGMPASGHLDADELAAFAENALPDRTRQLYIAHMADCDSCRKMLSGFIAAAPETAAAAAAFSGASEAAAAVSVPWYRRIFRTPNLAFTMGSLVVVLGGLIGLVVWENRFAPNNSEVSKVAEQPAATSPRYDERPELSAAANTMSNSAANANTGSSVESVTRSGVSVGSTNMTADAKNEEKPAATMDELKTTDQPAPAVVPQPPPKDIRDAPMEREVDLDKEKVAKTEDRSRANDDLRNRTDLQNQNQNQRDLSPGANSAKRAAGPRQVQSQTQTAELSASGRVLSSLRSVGGKTFELRDGVWYDTAYTGQSKKGFKRGTEKYIRLDAGLRSIADQISGTVVIVWEGKAYRIK